MSVRTKAPSAKESHCWNRTTGGSYPAGKDNKHPRQSHEPKTKDPSGGTTGRVKPYGRLGWMGARARYSLSGRDHRSHTYCVAGDPPNVQKAIKEFFAPRPFSPLPIAGHGRRALPRCGPVDDAPDCWPPRRRSAAGAVRATVTASPPRDRRFSRAAIGSAGSKTHPATSPCWKTADGTYPPWTLRRPKPDTCRAAP
jgi:hypothetical protein